MVWTFMRECVSWCPLTAGGAISLPVVCLALRYVALQEHDRLVLAACVGGLCLIVVLALVVLSVGLWLRFYPVVVPTHVAAMESMECSTGLVLPWIVSIPCVTVNIAWLNCEGVEVHLVPAHAGYQEVIRASQRVQRSKIVRQFGVRDVFGLCRVKFSKSFAQSLRVEPFPAAGSSVTQIRRDQQGDDLAHPNGKPHGDLIEMRHYRPGDPLKLVLWKHYARSGQLLVRQPENSIATMSQTVACFVAGPGDEASAGVARTIVMELAQAGEEILFQADGSASATDSASEAIEQIIQSIDVRENGGGIITAMGSTIQSNVSKHCLAFVPSQPGPWIDTLLAGQTCTQLHIDAIIGIDEPSRRRQIPIFPHRVLRRDNTDTTQRAQVQAVVERLSAAGIPTQIIHRKSGQAVSAVVWQGVLS